jgi:hypothetical protein
MNILTRDKLQKIHDEGRLHIPLKVALQALEDSQKRNTPNTFLFGAIEPTKEELDAMPRFSPPEVVQCLDYIFSLRGRVPPELLTADSEDPVVITQRMQVLLIEAPKLVPFQQRYTGIFMTAASYISDADRYKALKMRIKSILTMQVQGATGEEAVRMMQESHKKTT